RHMPPCLPGTRSARPDECRRPRHRAVADGISPRNVPHAHVPAPRAHSGVLERLTCAERITVYAGVRGWFPFSMSLPQDRPGVSITSSTKPHGVAAVARDIVGLGAIVASLALLIDSWNPVSLVVFLATGAVIVWLRHRLRVAEEAHRTVAASANARAERLDAILNTTTDGIIVIDANGDIEAFNRGAEELFGYPEWEVKGGNVRLLMPSPHHEEHGHYLEGYLRTGEARIIGIGREVTARRRDGTLFPVHLSVGEMRIGGERKFTGLLRDLTKRARLDERLEASEARWRAIVDSAVDGIVVIDEHGCIEGFNPAAERLFGHTEADVLGHNVDMLMPSPYREQHDTYLSRYLATGRPKIIGIGREVTGMRKDGTTFPLHLAVGQLTIGGARKFTGILHDLSARVRMEEEMREQAALARLGEMAAVVAHEVKNPLAGIRGAIQVFGSRMTQDAASAPIVQEIIDRIDSLDQMMKDLLLFARPPKPRRAPIDIVPLVTITANLLSRDPSLRDVEVDV